ncbi:MAG: transcription-repair coupling factor, partial [Candidatus Gracilibacteria bacterium]
DVSEQNQIKKAMMMWGDRPVFIYTKKNEEERLSYPTSSAFDRDKTIGLVEFVSRVYDQKEAIFVVDFNSLLQNFPDIKELLANRVEIKTGEVVDSVELIGRIVNLGYEIGEKDFLKKGQYYRLGDVLNIFPVNSGFVWQVDIGFEKAEKIKAIDPVSGEIKERKVLEIFPIDYDTDTENVMDLFTGNSVAIDDEVDVVDEYYELWNQFMDEAQKVCSTVTFTSFNEDDENHKHLHFLSVVKYRSAYDLANDLRDRIAAGWKTIFFTKNGHETRSLLLDQKVPFANGLDEEKSTKAHVFVMEIDKEDVFPDSFQAPDQKILLISDLDLALVREERRGTTSRNVFDDFLTGLKSGDYVVHDDHGIARFGGLDRKTVDGITKEYLKLEYAENDKLFVPIDQAEKVNKYIGSEEMMPHLTRLGSAEWNTVTNKVKKETQEIAKELLMLYAERRTAKGVKFKIDNDLQAKFEKTFPYEETPGQVRAIVDVKEDMEKGVPMDRLVCGDVGFGKTEVAMRAAFKAAQSGKQVALIAPITILADQHYKSFKKRMDEFNVRIEMLSRFKKPFEQKEILVRLAKGEVDIVIGTHRLLQPDVKFKDIGLLIIDEEQRFGVKQKEVLKKLRKEVDVLTLTATPIPRTLNICLNKLRDITTITTPPFGRLPVITEVRKFSPSLVRDAILHEVKRGGQVYFLHNRVQTIDGFADKLRGLVPEAKFEVAHGKLGSGDLEERIMAFKDHKFDVLVSSTIIENGIDLENANTLIVNNAERFGLAQLYQLRGRVGRGKTQAYAYFLYHGQRLKLDAKKRLRAIVEASDLGSGFQIAMKDLEIRGAGDILGANQHGVIHVVGVSHFMRMLNKAVEDLKAGRVYEGEEEVETVVIELPIQAYIPDGYIPQPKDKINTYQKLSSADTLEYLHDVRDELLQDYGKMPPEVESLFAVIELKIYAKKAHILNVKAETVPMSKDKEIVLYMSKKVKPANIVSLLEFNEKWIITGTKLRINIRDLGVNWAKGLKDSLVKLGQEKKHGGGNFWGLRRACVSAPFQLSFIGSLKCGDVLAFDRMN